jgi:glycosidase
MKPYVLAPEHIKYHKKRQYFRAAGSLRVGGCVGYAFQGLSAILLPEKPGIRFCNHYTRYLIPDTQNINNMQRFDPVEWSYNTNLYEVNLRQYTPSGTFNEFAKELPRLAVMGVETLWFMPITPISVEKRQGSLGSYYACSDYKSVNPEFGTLNDFKSLVAQAHSWGMKVIIDWVANHTGWDHVWVKTNPEFYKKNAAGEFYDNNNWIDVIDLNYYDQAMRREMISSMRFWLDQCDLDGFRCDMAHLVPLDFWREAREELDKIKPLFWLAESEEVNYNLAFDALYAWDWMHKTEHYIKGQIGMDKLHESLVAARKKFPPDVFHLFFTSNHDENSWCGTEYEKYGHAARALAVFSFTWNGLPLVYSGQELPNYKRLKFFDKDHIEWNGEYELEDFYKALISLRKNNPALTAGYLRSETHTITTNHPNEVLAFIRQKDEKQVVVVLNFSKNTLSLEVNHASISGSYRNIFSGETVDLSTRQDFNIDGGGYLVFEK